MAQAKDRALSLLRFLGPLVVVAAAWQLAVSIGLVDASTLSSPVRVARAFRDLLIPEPLLLQYLGASLYRLLIGYVTGCVSGLVLGFLMGCRQRCYLVLHPISTVLMAVPSICWVPLLLITVGMGDITIITAVFLDCIFPVAHSTLSGVRTVDRDVVRASRAMGVGGVRMLFHVLLPGALPSIMTGLRLAAGYSWRALVGAEMLAATASGIGFMVYAARAFYDVDVMFVGLATISLCGLLMDHVILGGVERRTVQKWGLLRKTW